MVNRIKIKKAVKKIIIWLCILLLFYLPPAVGVEFTGYVKPTTEPLPLGEVLNKETLNESDYQFLFCQTGLGKPAVDDLRKTENYLETFEKFQKNFLTPIDYTCQHINPVTREETIIDKATGLYRPGFDLAPYRRGDILLSFSTHTLSMRHGHAALVVGEQSTLESIMLGYDSMLQDIGKWQYYNTFALLRLTSAPQETIDDIVAFTLNHMQTQPYTPFAGLIGPKNPPADQLMGTQCAHLAWYPFKQFGYDIDSDGGWLVTPRNILHSDILEVVQIFGLDPNEFLQ